ncbi:unnamed protein product [Musa hybrid cultivar]
MDSFPAYIEAVGWTVWLGSVLLLEVYMMQPEGFVSKNCPDKVCRLLRSIYGLKQASRSWNIRFDEAIRSYDFGLVGAQISLRIKPMSNEQRRQEVNSRMTEFVPLLITTSLLASRIELPLRHGSLRPPGR